MGRTHSLEVHLVWHEEKMNRGRNERGKRREKNRRRKEKSKHCDSHRKDKACDQISVSVCVGVSICT